MLSFSWNPAYQLRIDRREYRVYLDDRSIVGTWQLADAIIESYTLTTLLASW